MGLDDRDYIRARRNHDPQSGADGDQARQNKLIIACPKCTGALRVPVGLEINVSCGHCGNSFRYPFRRRVSLRNRQENAHRGSVDDRRSGPPWWWGILWPGLLGGLLAWTNPTPSMVYEELASEIKTALKQSDTRNPLGILLQAGIAASLDASTVEPFFAVEHHDYVVASVFVVTPSSITKMGFKFAGKTLPDGQIVLCGAGGYLLKCPKFVANTYSASKFVER